MTAQPSERPILSQVTGLCWSCRNQVPLSVVRCPWDGHQPHTQPWLCRCSACRRNCAAATEDARREAAIRAEQAASVVRTEAPSQWTRRQVAENRSGRALVGWLTLFVFVLAFFVWCAIGLREAFGL